MAKQKKEVFLTQESISFIKNNFDGKYSEFCRVAVEEKIQREVKRSERERVD